MHHLTASGSPAPATDAAVASPARAGADDANRDELRGAAPCDPVRLTGLVQAINRIARGKRLAAALEIGGLLIAERLAGACADGDDQERYGQALQALAKRPDLQVSRSFLFYCVAVAGQARLMPQTLVGALSFEHHKVLLAAPDVQAKCTLAAAAVAEAWTCAELRAAMPRRAAVPRRRSGRPPMPGFVRAARLVQEAVQLLTATAVAHDEIVRLGFCESAQSVGAGLAGIRALLAEFEALDDFINPEEPP